MPDKSQTTDILERIADLHKQATTEHSHYYVASTLEASAHEIVRLRAKIGHLRNAIRNLVDGESEAERHGR